MAQGQPDAERAGFYSHSEAPGVPTGSRRAGATMLSRPLGPHLHETVGALIVYRVAHFAAPARCGAVALGAVRLIEVGRRRAAGRKD